MSKELEVNAPKVIYLQIGDDHEGEYSDEATWCADKIHNTDIAYVLRSDCDELAAKLAEAERLNKVALEAMRRLMLCDMAEVRTIKGSSGAIDNARNAIKELEKPL